MNTTSYIFVSGVKGGVGTTSLVLMLGLDLAGSGKLVAIQTADRDDLVAHLGSHFDMNLVTNNIKFGLNCVMLEETAHGYDYVIVDCGTMEPEQFASLHLLPWNEYRQIIRCTDNSFPALRKAAMVDGPTAGLWVVLHDDYRSLDRRNVEGALGGVPCFITKEPSVARMFDAGLLLSRAPAKLTNVVRTIGRRCETLRWAAGV